MFRKCSQLSLNFIFKNGTQNCLSGLAARHYQSLYGSQLKPNLPTVCSGHLPLTNVIKEDPLTTLRIINPARKSLIDSMVDLPLKPDIVYSDIDPFNKTIQDPSEIVEKQAARLIVIRRRKMKRHRLKKLRKRMKFEWGKIRQRREMRKEKAFQAELMGKIKEAKKFDPTTYAAEKIRKANEVLTHTKWRSQNMPESYLNELIEKKESKMRLNIERAERRKNVDLDPSHYKY